MPVKKTPILSILIPTFNEAGTLPEVLRKIQTVRLSGVKKDVIIVNDGSTDQSRSILKKYKKLGIKILHHQANKGKGAAIKTALPFATGDFIIIQDADLEYDPTDYPKLLKPLLQNRAKVVYGTRFQNAYSSFSFLNYFGNRILTFIANLLFNANLTDLETGYKVFHSSVLKKIQFQARGFDFDPEITAEVLKYGYRILEVPISYQARNYRNGKKITWRDGFSALFCLLRFRFGH